jgi:tetratricopeptide (TPR) repeat protein
VATDAAVTLSYLHLHTSPEEGLYGEVERELEDAISLLKELGDDAGLARALGVAGTLRFWRGEAAAAIEDLERAARYAREVGDRAQEAESLEYVLVAMLWGPTPVDQALERVEELRPRTLGHRRLEVDLLRTRAQLEAMQGRFDPARELIAQAKAVAEEVGLELTLNSGVADQAAYVELLAGDAAAVERELRPACKALERMGSWANLASLAPWLADALIVQGRDEEAVALIELAERSTMSDDVDAEVKWRRVRAKLLARRGEVESGEVLAREATALAARTDLLDLRAHAVADLAEVLRLAGRPEEAAAAVQEAIRLHEQKGNIAAAALLAGTPTPASR